MEADLRRARAAVPRAGRDLLDLAAPLPRARHPRRHEGHAARAATAPAPAWTPRSSRTSAAATRRARAGRREDGRARQSAATARAATARAAVGTAAATAADPPAAGAGPAPSAPSGRAPGRATATAPAPAPGSRSTERPSRSVPPPSRRRCVATGRDARPATVAAAAVARRGAATRHRAADGGAAADGPATARPRRLKPAVRQDRRVTNRRRTSGRRRATDGAPVDGQRSCRRDRTRSDAALARYADRPAAPPARLLRGASPSSCVGAGHRRRRRLVARRGRARDAAHRRPAPPASRSSSPVGRAAARRWRTTDRLADRRPAVGRHGRHLLRHTVRRTRRPHRRATWSYTRTDRTVCTAGQVGGTTIAVFEIRGNCDEVDALHSGTGSRRWTRTLDMDGSPLNGRPAFQRRRSRCMVTHRRSAIYAIDPATGYNRWTYHRYGCHDRRRGAGHGRRADQPDLLDRESCCRTRSSAAAGRSCSCATRDAGDSDDKSKDNADKIMWITRRQHAAVPVSADAVVSAATPDGSRLHPARPGTGKAARRARR